MLSNVVIHFVSQVVRILASPLSYNLIAAVGLRKYAGSIASIQKKWQREFDFKIILKKSTRLLN